MKIVNLISSLVNTLGSEENQADKTAHTNIDVASSSNQPVNFFTNQFDSSFRDKYNLGSPFMLLAEDRATVTHNSRELVQPLMTQTPSTIDGLWDDLENRAKRATGRDDYKISTEPGKKTMIGFRNITRTDSTSYGNVAGKGKFDDTLYVMWTEKDKEGKIVKHIKTFDYNTEPSAQYDSKLAGTKKKDGDKEVTIAKSSRGILSGNDADGDGYVDLGRLPAGEYYYVKGDSTKWPRSLKPDRDIEVNRDVNHDGVFDENDRVQINQYKERLVNDFMKGIGTKNGKPMSRKDAESAASEVIKNNLSSGRTILFHNGGTVARNSSGITNQNTFSSGCQTIPGQDFDKFWELTGANLKQGEKIHYILIEQCGD
jgi:hypothetical protein